MDVLWVHNNMVDACLLLNLQCNDNIFQIILITSQLANGIAKKFIIEHMAYSFSFSYESSKLQYSYHLLA